MDHINVPCPTRGALGKHPFAHLIGTTPAEDAAIIAGGRQAILSSKALLLHTPGSLQGLIEARDVVEESTVDDGKRHSPMDGIEGQIQALYADLDELEQTATLLHAILVGPLP